MMEKYSEAAYGAIQNIQQQCAADFRNICPTSPPYMNLNGLISKLFSADQDTYVFRRKLATENFKTGAEYVDHLRSLFSNRYLPTFVNPLTHVMYWDEKSKKYVNPNRQKDLSGGLRANAAVNPLLSKKPR
eukprot:CAMPEP_0176317426 /NCGR_PEP_ID=MMETSP0121_2-20121125/69241_1 /TAXON_ID=160619 /ORGANISM="Kryptoperidinium foliaceum, Strain CCMP 1326" /LENGTH=130 /DNA_ID=CAMNT_0017659665 /DNA_START=141 /DNA_END=529 /DNA_ORIENTATION=-